MSFETAVLFEALKGVKQTSERIQKRVESYIKTCEQRKEIYQGE